MLIRIAVRDPLPMYRRGILATLGDAGFDADSPDDLMAWTRDEERRFVLLTLQSPDDWNLLVEIQRIRPHTGVIALLADPIVPNYVRALEAGAIGAVPRDARPVVLHEAFNAAVRGRSVLPIEVLRALSSGAKAPESLPDKLTDQELPWLRELAKGMTVAQLAANAGYSERMMFRLLRSTYTKLNTTSRTEALIAARDRGLL